MKPGLVIALAMSALLASASGGRAQTKPASETRSGSSVGGVQAAATSASVTRRLESLPMGATLVDRSVSRLN